MLRARRARSRELYRPSDPRYGMPTGNDEADLAWTTTQLGNNSTELPFLSIAAEMWRGFRDCGEALVAAAAEASGNPDSPMKALGQALVSEAPSILQDLRQSMARSVVPADPPGAARCHPYVAGVPECGMLPKPVASKRDSEPWRSYSEALYSGAIEEGTIAEILAWHQTERGSGVRGSRLKLGVLSGCGGDVSCGDSLETFTLHGWGYGLLQADLIEPFLLRFYAVSAHAYTRGTWIAPESTPIDRSQSSPPFATPSGVTAPIYLKWMLLWEHPSTRAVWLLKALPRVWLSHGETLLIQGASSAYGKLSLELESSINTTRSIAVNISVPTPWTTKADVPPGGLYLRLRAPVGHRMVSATIGGDPWKALNATSESIFVSQEGLCSADMLARLQRIVVWFA